MTVGLRRHFRQVTPRSRSAGSSLALLEVALFASCRTVADLGVESQITVERRALFPNGDRSPSPGFDAQRRTLGCDVRDISTPRELHHDGPTEPDD